MIELRGSRSLLRREGIETTAHRAELVIRQDARGLDLPGFFGKEPALIDRRLKQIDRRGESEAGARHRGACGRIEHGDLLAPDAARVGSRMLPSGNYLVNKKVSAWQQSASASLAFFCKARVRASARRTLLACSMGSEV